MYPTFLVILLVTGSIGEEGGDGREVKNSLFY
jgi:hypothetical protein